MQKLRNIETAKFRIGDDVDEDFFIFNHIDFIDFSTHHLRICHESLIMVQGSWVMCLGNLFWSFIMGYGLRFHVSWVMVQK